MTQVIAVFFEALEATDHKLRREVRVVFVYACCQFILGLMLLVQTFKLENVPAILNRTLCHYLQWSFNFQMSEVKGLFMSLPW